MDLHQVHAIMTFFVRILDSSQLGILKAYPTQNRTTLSNHWGLEQTRKSNNQIYSIIRFCICHHCCPSEKMSVCIILHSDALTYF